MTVDPEFHVAALLANALIAKSGAASARDAVKIYREILAELNKQGGVNSPAAGG